MAKHPQQSQRQKLPDISVQAEGHVLPRRHLCTQLDSAVKAYFYFSTCGVSRLLVNHTRAMQSSSKPAFVRALCAAQEQFPLKGNLPGEDGLSMLNGGINGGDQAEEELYQTITTLTLQ